MEIASGVHWIHGLGSNLFLWLGRNGYVLVDTGAPGDSTKVLDYLQTIGVRSEELSHILITHADFDHAGSAAVLQKRSGAKIFCGKLTAEYLVAGRSPKHLPVILRSIADLVGRYRSVPEAAVETFNDSEMINGLDGWLALATPGHCPDHFSFCLPAEGIVFAGDALSMRGGKLKMHPRLLTADLTAARESAIRLLKFTPSIINCGHGPPLRDHNADQLLSFYHNQLL